MGARKIRADDEVVVTTGKDRGKRGRVLRVLTKHDRIIVEGVNLVTRHLKRNPQNPQAGGRVHRPGAIAMSNVALWSDSDGKGVRVRITGTGKEKARVSAKSGATIGGHKGGKAARPAKEKKK